jgi:hypothetical protein
MAKEEPLTPEEQLEAYKRTLRDCADRVAKGDLPEDPVLRLVIASALKHVAETVTLPRRPRGNPNLLNVNWIDLAFAVKTKRLAYAAARKPNEREKTRTFLYQEVAREERVDAKTVQRAYVAFGRFVEGFNPR